MKVNPSRPVRVALYVLTAVGTPVVAYLKVKGIIDDPAVALWSGEVAVVNTLAALNVGSADIPAPEVQGD